MTKYKVLKSVAHNLGHSFLSDMNTVDGFVSFVPQQLLDIATDTGEPTVIFDFVARIVQPPVFESPEAMKSLAMYADMLEDLVIRQGAARDMVIEARLTLSFDLERTARSGSRRPHFVCDVEIRDDRGLTHRGSPKNWWSDPMGGRNA